MRFRDHASDLCYLRNCREAWEKGLYAELGAYRCQVFVDFSVVRDDEKGRWSGLAGELSGRGVPNLDTALRERELRPLTESFRALVELHQAAAATPATTVRAAKKTDAGEAVRKYDAFLDAALPFSGRLNASAARELFDELSVTTLPAKAQKMERAMRWAWVLLRPLAGSAPAESPVAGWIDEWMIGGMLGGMLERSGWDAEVSRSASALVDLLLALPDKAARLDWKTLFARPAAVRLLGVHSFEGTTWFRKESLEAVTAAAAVILKLKGTRPPKMQPLLDAAETAGYRWESFVSALSSPAR